MISLYNSMILMNKPIIVPETTEASSYYEGMIDDHIVDESCPGC